MQVVPENLNITNGYQVFETPDALYINNQAYDKFTMESKPYDFFNINYHLNHKNMLKYQINLLEYNYVVPFKEPNYQYIIQDNQDSNIFYCICEVDKTNSNQYFCKFKKENNRWNLINNIQPNSSYNFPGYPNYQPNLNYTNYKILGQTKDYIILYQKKMGSSRRTDVGVSEAFDTFYDVVSSLNYISINKQTMTFSTLNVKNDCKDLGIFTIKQTDNFLYIYENLSNTIFNIIKYNPSTNTRTVIHTINMLTVLNKENWTQMSGISNIIKFKNKYYCLSGPNNKTNGYYAFIVYNINFENDDVSYSIERMEDYNDYFPFKTATSGNNNCEHRKISLSNIDDKYIHVTMHDNVNALFWAVYFPGHARYSSAYNAGISTVDNNIYINDHCSVLFEFHDDYRWLPIKRIDSLSGNKIQGIYYYNQYIPIFITNNGIFCFKFNQNTKDFDLLFNNSGKYYTLGMDENNTLYLFDENDNCEIYSKNTVNELKTEFEYEEYNYDNQNINSYVKIYAKNFLKDYIKTKVKLTLTGQCYFNQNNQKELITYTDKNGIKNIPITITYGGTLNCDIQELE